MDEEGREHRQRVCHPPGVAARKPARVAREKSTQGDERNDYEYEQNQTRLRQCRSSRHVGQESGGLAKQRTHSRTTEARTHLERRTGHDQPHERQTRSLQQPSLLTAWTPDSRGWFRAGPTSWLTRLDEHGGERRKVLTAPRKGSRDRSSPKASRSNRRLAPSSRAVDEPTHLQ